MDQGEEAAHEFFKSKSIWSMGEGSGLDRAGAFCVYPGSHGRRASEPEGSAMMMRTIGTLLFLICLTAQAAMAADSTPKRPRDGYQKPVPVDADTSKKIIEWVGVDVDLSDFQKGMPILKRELLRLGAPPTSVLEYTRDGKKTEEQLQ